MFGIETWGKGCIIIDIIILKSYELNIEFQHFVLKFNRISSLYK
jgi:hypothetical protein